MVGGKKRPFGYTGWLSTLSFGFLLVLLGAIWVITPNLSNALIEFFESFHLEELTEHIVLPMPEGTHVVVYKAAMQFCLAFGVFQIVIVALRFIFHDSLDKKSGTISSMVFWLITGFFLNMLVNEPTKWSSFLAGLIISIGLAVIISNLVKLFKRR